MILASYTRKHFWFTCNSSIVSRFNLGFWSISSWCHIMCNLRVHFHSFTCVDILFPQHILYSLHTLGADHLIICYRVFFFFPWMFGCAFMPILGCFDYCRFVVCFELRKRETFSFVVLVVLLFGILWESVLGLEWPFLFLIKKHLWYFARAYTAGLKGMSMESNLTWWLIIHSLLGRSW